MGNARQLGHLQAITLAGGAGLDVVQEDNIIVVFGGIEMDIADAVQSIRQGGDFKIVGGKQRKWPGFPRQVFHAGPGQ